MDMLCAACIFRVLPLETELCLASRQLSSASRRHWTVLFGLLIDSSNVKSCNARFEQQDEKWGPREQPSRLTRAAIQWCSDE